MALQKKLKHEVVVGLNQWATDLVADFLCGDTREVASKRNVADSTEILEERKPIFGNYSFFRTRKKSDVIVDLITDVVSGAHKEEYSSYRGAGDDLFPLHKYRLHDGRVYYEVEQEDLPWLNRPLVFFVLKYQHANGALVKESIWTKEEAFRTGHI